MQLPTTTLLAVLPFFIRHAFAGASGTGTTTRYWDCCKPSCSWGGKASLLSGSSPVQTCSVNDTPLSDPNAVSGCNGGGAYMCTDQSPWAVTDNLAYGFAAVNIAGGSESSWCCACYELTFQSGNAKGKKMVVQATNTGGDLAGNQFDINMPGGGVGIFNGCTTQFGAPSSGWGAQYGGISSRSDCDSFPTALKAGCYWRFDWFGGSDNPGVDFKQVACPAAITAKSKCTRADDSSMPAPDAASGAAAPVVVASSAAAVAPVVVETPTAVVPAPVVVASTPAAPVVIEAATPTLVAPVVNEAATPIVPVTQPTDTPISAPSPTDPIALPSTIQPTNPATKLTIAPGHPMPTSLPSVPEPEEDDGGSCEADDL